MFIGMEIGEHIPVNSEMVAGLTAVLLKNLEAKFFWWESYLRELEETSGGRSPLLMSTTAVSLVFSPCLKEWALKILNGIV